jgi:hypothetical protein
MSSAIRDDPGERQCKGKRSYLKKRDAKQAAKQAPTTLGGAAMHAYSCGSCGKFHVGHKAKFEPKQTKR